MPKGHVASDSWTQGNTAWVHLDSEWFDAEEWSDDCPAGGASWTLWTETQLDTLGRPLNIHQPDGTDISFGYIGDSTTTTTKEVASSIDGLSGDAIVLPVYTTQITDALGRLRSLEEQVNADPGDPGDHSWYYKSAFEYDEKDRLTSVQLFEPGSSDAQTRSYTYSGAGFLLESTEPERTITIQGYDAVGNLTKQTAGGVITSNDFDVFGRLLWKHTGGEPLVDQTWGDDESASIGEYAYNRITEATRTNRYEGGGDVKVTHEWGYGQPGGRTWYRGTQIDDLGTANDWFYIGYEYDLWGNQSRVMLPTWNGCRFSIWEYMIAEYDGSWLEAVKLETYLGVEKTAGEFSYHPNGRVDTLSYGSPAGATWQETADLDGVARPRRIRLNIDGGADDWNSGEFEYDAAGNIWAEGDKRYIYDGLSRLTEYSEYTSQWGHLRLEGYEYDRWGNMTKIFDPSVGGTELEFAMEDVLTPIGVPDNNRIKTVDSGTSKTVVELEWDDRGNLEIQGAADPLNAKEFKWTGDDRLQKSVSNPGPTSTTWQFAYDAAGERVLKWHDGGSGPEATFYIRNEAGQVISEWEYLTGGAGFDVRKDYVTFGSNTIAEIDHLSHLNKIWNVAADHLGSTRVLFAEKGTIVDEMEYLPFGALDGYSGIPETPHLFTGHERDLGEGSSELDYMHQRYYSNQLARFVSVDPVPGATGSSQSWNRYSYTQNNPLKFVDPNGEDLYLVFDFQGSGLSTAIQNAVMYGVRKQFLGAGVNTVNIYHAGSGIPAENELRDFDTIVNLHFTKDRLTRSAHGANRMVALLLSNHADVSSYNIRNFTNTTSIVNYLINVALHESIHGSRTIPEYDGDSRGGPSGPPGSPTQQGVKTHEFAQGVRQFSAWEANRLQQMLNPGEEGDTEEWLAKMKAEMGAARARRRND